MAVVEEEQDEDAVVVVMRRTVRYSTWLAAHGGWVDDVTGRLGSDLPDAEPFSKICQ